jgi:hypothetical protein
MGTGGGGARRSRSTVVFGNERDDVVVEVLDRVVGDGDLDRGMVVGLVVADHEPERLEEGSEVLMGGVEKIYVEDR